VRASIVAAASHASLIPMSRALKGTAKVIAPLRGVPHPELSLALQRSLAHARAPMRAAAQPLQSIEFPLLRRERCALLSRLLFLTLDLLLLTLELFLLL